MKWPGDASKWTWRVYNIQVGPTVNLAIKVLPQNLNRAYVLFQDDSGGCLIGDSNVHSSGPYIFNLSLTQFYKEFTYSLHGPMVWKEWWSTRGSGQSQLQITEVVYVGFEQIEW